MKPLTTIVVGLMVEAAVAAQAPVQINPEGERVQRVLASRRTAALLAGQDYAEIQMLYARVARSLDTRADQGRAFAAAFTPDGIFIDTTTGKLYQGAEQLAAYARTSAPTSDSLATVRHLMHNIMIESAPEGATGKAYVAIVRAASTGQPITVVDSGQYWDVLEKTAEGWRLRKRNFHRATLAPPNPAQPTR
jgi:hypothetical protein